MFPLAGGFPQSHGRAPDRAADKEREGRELETIAHEKMPANLRAAHDRNDETLERIYIGRRSKNDTERLETLFDLYIKMAGAPSSPSARRMRKPMMES